MAHYMIEVDEKAVDAQITNILNQMFNAQMDRKYSGIDEVIREAAREIVYSRKDEIIERVVERASREIMKKGLPKLLERMEGK